MDFLYRLIIVFLTLGILGQGQAFLGEGQPKSWYCQPAMVAATAVGIITPQYIVFTFIEMVLMMIFRQSKRMAEHPRSNATLIRKLVIEDQLSNVL